MKSLFACRRKLSRIQKLCICALCVLAVYVMADIPFFSEYLFARGITRFASGLIGAVTGLFFVSFYECAAVLLILGGVALAIGFAVLLCKRRFSEAATWLYRLVAALLAVALAYGVLYAPLYGRKSAISALGLSDVTATQENVYAAAEYYVEELNALSAAMERDGEGNAVCPYSFCELSRLLNDEYDKLGNYFFRGDVRVKQVALSVPMSYLGITGIYFPFFAEANVNVNIPSNELPATMAHEMAHAKGVSLENEANVVSYVVCIRSENGFIRYSGLMRAAARLLNSLGEEEFEELYARLCPQVRQEYANANAHYAKYEGVIDQISSFFNDLFLRSNGVASGTKSYGETAESLVALYYELTGEDAPL